MHQPIVKHYILPFSPRALGSSCGVTCPRCRSPVFRVSRRLADLFISFFVSIRRYRCISMECSWEGNIRVKPGLSPGKTSELRGEKQ